MSSVRLTWLCLKTPWQMYLSIKGLRTMADFIVQNKHFGHYDMVQNSHSATYNLIQQQVHLGVADLVFELYEELFVKYQKFGFKKMDLTSIAHHLCEAFFIRFCRYNHEAFGILFAISNQFGGLFFNSHKIISILNLAKKSEYIRKFRFVNALCILLTFIFYRIVVVLIFIEYALRLLFTYHSNGFYSERIDLYARFYYAFVPAWSCLAIPDCIWFSRCIKFWKIHYIQKKYHKLFWWTCWMLPLLFYVLVIRYYLWNQSDEIQTK